MNAACRARQEQAERAAREAEGGVSSPSAVVGSCGIFRSSIEPALQQAAAKPSAGGSASVRGQQWGQSRGRARVRLVLMSGRHIHENLLQSAVSAHIFRSMHVVPNKG